MGDVLSSEDLTAVEKVVVVIPALNEEGGIGIVLDAIRDVLQKFRFEVLVVDGGSEDRTAAIANGKDAVVIKQGGVGYGDALQEGFKYACSKMNAAVLVMMDADGTYDARELPKMIAPIAAGKADLVLGNRFDGLRKGAMSWTNRLGNRVLSLIAHLTLGTNVSDTQTGLRALSAESWRRLDMTALGMPFAVEMIAEASESGCRISEIPISYSPRIGLSKLSPRRDAIRILATILRLMRDYQPMHFFGSIGATLIVLGSIEGLTVVAEFLSTGTVRRIPSVVLSATLLLGGVVILVLGLIADMIKELKRFVRKVSAKG